MTIEAVIFDIGGVLEVNPRTGWPERWAERLGMEVAAFSARLSEIWRAGSIGGCTLEEVERRIAEALDIELHTLALLMDDAWSEYLGSLNEALAEYFSGLRPRYRTAILSNSFVGAREREQAAYGFEDMCDAVVYSHEIGLLKPDARSYRAVCQTLGVAPDAALFLDDVEANVEGAIEFGMQAITYSDNEQAIAEVQARLNRSLC